MDAIISLLGNQKSSLSNPFFLNIN
jgi:hypothetical protein